MLLDARSNFAKVTVSAGYDAVAVVVVLNSGQGAKLPAFPFNATWWNATDYPDPSDDPNVEIVRVTAIAADTLTMTRGQEGTSASTKNTTGKIYKIVAGLTKKTVDDIDAHLLDTSSLPVMVALQGDGVTQMRATWPWSAPTKVTQPATVPTNDSYGCSFSPCGQFVALCCASSPFIFIYQRTGSTFTKLANPATLPAGLAYKCSFSPDGQFLTVGHANSPYITIYQRSGSTFTKLSNPSSLPPDAVGSISWSSCGRFMAITMAVTSPYIVVYERGGATFTKLSDPGTLPPNGLGYCALSPNGEFLVVGSSITPYITIYQRSGTTWTKLSDPATLPTFSSGGANGVAWSPDGQYLAVIGFSDSPYLVVYQRSGTTFTKLANPATLPSGAENCAFSPDNRYIAVGRAGSPLTIYSLSGTTLTKIADPAAAPASTVTGVSWSPDMRFIACSEQSASPYVEIYETAGSPPSGPVLAVVPIR